MPPRKKAPRKTEDLTRKAEDLSKAQKDALSNLFTLHQATKQINVGYQTLMGGYKSGALRWSHRLDYGDQRSGEKGLPLFTKAELDRWNKERKSRGLTVEKVDQFLANADPEQVKQLLEKYRAHTT